MDTIFHKTTSIFNVVSVARNEPRRYGKNGELLISYDDTEEAAAHGGGARRGSSTAGAGHKRPGVPVDGASSNVGEKRREGRFEDVGKSEDIGGGVKMG